MQTIHDAAEAGDTEAVRELLEQGVDVNARDAIHWTPLHRAVAGGHSETVAVLLEE